MLTVRSLRRDRGLTLVGLALLADIPARTLAQIECGIHTLDPASRIRLARIFGVRPDILDSHLTQSREDSKTQRSISLSDFVSLRLGVEKSGHNFRRVVVANRQVESGELSYLRRAGLALLVVLLGFALDTPAYPSPTAVGAPPAQAPSAARVSIMSIEQPVLPRRQARLSVAPRPSPASTAAASTATAIPPTATPAFALAEDGPHGCPLAATGGRIVITQGYDEGTHAPASVWGAIDLGIDTDGDGVAEPDATRGVTILATHGGVAHVFVGSWPGGNFVRVTDEQSGWSTAYAHLDTIAAVDDQPLSDGATIGTVGSTGYATGPHLHYEVWHGDTNIDPTGLIECGE